MSRHNPDVFVFQKGVERARNLCGIHTHAKSQFPRVLNCDDILRSAIVIGFSSLDLLIHSISKNEILYRYRNRIEVKRLVVPFNFFLSGRANIISTLETHISDAHGHKSFMAPDKIAEVLSYFVDEPWRKVSRKLSESEDVVKGTLRELVRWRNRIVHEQDINPQYGGIDLWPVISGDVDQGLNFLDALGPAIAQVIAESA